MYEINYYQMIERCHGCNGKGWVECSGEPKICPICNGTGDSPKTTTTTIPDTTTSTIIFDTDDMAKDTYYNLREPFFDCNS